MADIHVEEFFKDLAIILSRLYATFPRKSALFVEDVVGADEPDEFGLHSERHLACFAAMVWLGEEGYLRYEDTIRQEAIDQAVLTGRCFTLLSSAPANAAATGAPVAGGVPAIDAELPESVRVERQTTIHRLRQAVKSQSSNHLRGIVADLMTDMAQPIR